ncbi:disease resistance protein RGA4-like [Lolium rigidum]|uniref:disease resistance protein RGA4-like n=1 Tax=Lolium rigidum TaxID=89674 RepID=UPI001F5D4705|nr:disease resistance protein RGA4-like [Lolium rigidum]
MEAVVGTAAGKIAPKLLDFLLTNHKLRAELEHDIQYIKKEFVMISAAIREDDEKSGDVHSAWIQMVRDLAHDIEDCIDRFTHRLTLHGHASWIRQKLHRVKTVKARNKFAKAIRRLRKTSEEASVLRERYKREASKLRANCSSISNGHGESSNLVLETDEETGTETLLGMEAARDELMELISEMPQGQLKVISLVGFGGIGKTILARQAYDNTINENHCEAWAWVRAADKGAQHVLEEILRQLGSSSSSCGRLSSLRASLKKCLGTKRFFIVIDDMRTVFWHDIKDAFPVVPGVNSRVMVTTAIKSVANACSSAHGHVYVMRTLAKKHSRQLFFKEASLEDQPPPSDHTQLGTSEALTKCDGLPLALVTTAQFLQSRGNPERWTNLCKNLGKHLETEDTLARMKRVLIHSYTNLGSQDVKTCLLYLGIYPSGRPISRGSVIRKWLAEGFIKEDHKRSALNVAVDNFDELVNRSIIQPTDATSAEVKKCQTHGMMLEFILHKSMCENFITLLYDKDPLPGSNVRWLSLHNKTAARSKINPKDLCIVRSLTIFGKAHKSVLEFSMYKLLRVLDLEQCDEHLDDKHLKEICNLLLLRYLSLGAAVTVTVLPREIKKLQLLETLDVRRTKIEILPTEVIKLPCLVHLFGKFKLQHNVGDQRMGKLQTWLSENSRLETLAGFVVDKSQKFPQLMDYMEHLTKVKIWCESTGADAFARSSSSHLSKAIKGFIERGTQLNKARSLSLNINDERSQELLDFSLEKDYSYYLSSLKLQGISICSQLPHFVTMLGGLTKLCLLFPGDHRLSDSILDALSRVRGLEYLKLVANQLDRLVIKQGALRSLRRLCVVLKVITEMEIQEGALPRVESLLLLCKDLNGFSGSAIQSLPRLNKVALHEGLSDEVKHEWKEAAKNHPRHPQLLFVKTEPMGSEPAAETASDTTEVDDKREPTGPPTETTFSVTTPPDANSTGWSVQVVAAEMAADHKLMGSEIAAKISAAPATAHNTTLTVNHNAVAGDQAYRGTASFINSAKASYSR